MSSIVIAVIAATASVTAAVVAGVFAIATRRFDARLQRFDKAHDRISEQKFHMYEPIVEMLWRMFASDDRPTRKEKQRQRYFNTWVTVHGSAGTVRAYTRFVRALSYIPPRDIQFRLYADFLLAVRDDIGDPDGALDRIEILGPRLSSLGDPANLTDPDFDAVCRRLNWSMPWPVATEEGKRAEASHEATEA